MGMRKGRRSETYADENFKGYGIIKCAICRDPLAEHEGFGPCPKLKPGERLTASRKRQWENHEDDRDTEKARAKVSGSKAEHSAPGKGRGASPVDTQQVRRDARAQVGRQSHPRSRSETSAKRKEPTKQEPAG